MKKAELTCIAALTVLLVSCGNNTKSSSNQNPGASLQGPWEFVLPNANSTGETAYVDADLNQVGNSITTTQVEFLYIVPPANGGGEGWCTPTDSQSLSATLSGNSITGSVTTCFGSATFSGTVSNSTISGTYTASTGDAFNGSGSFTASEAASLSGTYSGTLFFLDQTTESVTLSISESGTTVTVTGSVTGADAGSISLSGVAIGNTALAQGTVSGQSFAVMGWLHAATLYVLDQTTGSYLGTLTKQ